MADNYLETVEIPDGTNLTIKDPNAAVGANSSTANNLPKFSGTDGKTLADSGVSVETTLTANSDAKIPTSKAVATHVTSAIGELDVTGSAYGAGKTILAWSETDGKVSITSQDISITKSQVSDFAHTHGSITNDGKITDTGVALASGDSLAFVDSSDSSKIKKTSVTFDGSTTTQALTKKGSFESFLQSHQTIKQDGVTGATVNRFGTCSTAAATAAKTVSITSGTFNLEAGARVSVKFTNANTANTPTLNVNSKGAKNIFHKGAQITTGSNKSLLAGAVDFIYDGTQWHLIGNYLDTDTKVNVTLGTTTKAYLLGTSTAPTSSAQAVTSIADTDVYLDSTAGKLHAKTLDATTYSGLPTATTSASGIVSLTDSVSTTSSTVAATATAVKTVNTLATTNQTNILSLQEADGSKNKLQVDSLSSTLSNGVSFTLNGDGTVTVKRETTSSSNSTCVIKLNDAYNYVDALCDGNYILSGCPSGGSSTSYELMATTASGVTYSYTKRDYGNGVELTDKGQATNIYVQLMVRSTFTGTVTFKPMICTKSQFDISNAYQPYSLPNTAITPELIELVDEGAKQKAPVSLANAKANASTQGTWNNDVYTRNGISFTLNSDMSVTVNGTATADSFFALTPDITMTEDCILTGCPTGGGSNKYEVQFSSVNNNRYDYGGSVKPVIQAGLTGKLLVGVRSGATVSNLKFYPMICTQAAWNVSHKYVPYRPNWDLVSSVAPFYSVPINHNMIYRGQNLGATFTDAQHTALSSGNFTDLFLGDYWTKSVTIPAGTYTGGDGEEVTVAAQTVTLKAVIADFDTFYAGYASTYAGINTHHAGVIVTGFNNVVWNKTNSTAGGYVSSLIHKWLVGSVLPQLESWFGSAKVLSHQKLLTNAITGDAASGWAWSSQKISLLSECQLYGMKVWGGSKATNGAYEPGEAFKKLDVFNHIDANLLFGNRNIWCRDIASAVGAALLSYRGRANHDGASYAGIAPAALILLS